MTPGFRKAAGAGAYQQGTPSIVALAGLEGALGIFEEVKYRGGAGRGRLALTGHLIALD